MKTKFTKKGRRILSAALCLLMMITALPMSAFAWTSEEGKSCTSSFGDYYVGSDGEYYRSKATYSFIVYDSKGNITVQSINAGTKSCFVSQTAAKSSSHHRGEKKPNAPAVLLTSIIPRLEITFSISASLPSVWNKTERPMSQSPQSRRR